jgi:hypothetical protein
MSQSRALVPHKAQMSRAFFIVPYLTPEEVARMGQACQGRHQTRDELLILTLFQTALMIWPECWISLKLRGWKPRGLKAGY